MKFLSACILLFISYISVAQMTQQEYIKEFCDMAVSEMKRSGVPASITLAQGILESGSGNSYLATSGKNHFGIKCGKWDGSKIYSDDDAKNECFRKYKNAGESYKDHSDFLKNNSRYSSLFELEITDYKSWAKGLKKAGYATSPTYAEKLIELIEKHELYKYDSGKYQISRDDSTEDKVTYEEGIRKVNRPQPADDNFQINLNNYNIQLNNNTAYIIIKNNTDVKTLAKEIDLMPWQIQNYNDLDKNSQLGKGDIIYIKPKKNKAEKGFDTHIVENGETMRDISQQYAIKLNKLYKRNNLEPGTEPKVGTKLNLRKKK